MKKLKMAKNYFIIRSDRAGVFAGELDQPIMWRNAEKDLILFNARRIFYWEGAASLSQMAIDGVSKPENCKFPSPIVAMKIFGVIEIIPCTEKAEKSIKGVWEWKK